MSLTMPATRSLTSPLPRLAAAAALVLTMAGCAEEAPAIPTAGGKLESTTLTVGILPIPDCAPIQIALDKGFFAAEGLTVKTEIVAGTAAAAPKLVSGAMDVMIANYVSTFAAQASGVADFTLIADAAKAGPGAYLLMVSTDSTIQSLAGLAGKKIGVNTRNGTGTLAIAAALKDAGVQVSDDQWVEVPLPNTGAALASGKIDAVYGVEPVITALRGAGKARALADLMTGTRADLAIAGWAVTDDYARSHPNTVAAFQRALLKAQNLAATDRSAIEAALPKYSKIDPKTAATLTLGGISTQIDPGRLQHAADLMAAYGYLDEELDVATLLPAAKQ